MSNLFGIPNIEGINDFSNKTNISSYTLFKMSSKPDLNYKKVLIPKNLGRGTRVLACPSYKLKAIQAWILRNILDNIQSHRNATAYNGKSLDVNLKGHVGNKFLICIDIVNFFPSTKRERVYDLFKSLGYNEQSAIMLTKFCTFEGGLPQGGVTSPALSNLINKDLDDEISKYCNAKSIAYTRYADDITISSNNKNKLDEALKYIEKVIQGHGYQINRDKTRHLHPGKQRKITGLVYSNDQKVGIGRRKRRILRSKIYNYENKEKFSSESTMIYNQIIGWLSFLKSVDSESYKYLKTYWKTLRNNDLETEVAATKQDK
ncbi:retron St85 family RNA-directed DNA polymerase [Ornithinibacillus massiliensis]|uniref:RNA-directed DNA polymerase n=1 Tax=Ornithinibacillus massiliensis TaxID=1944633 RepID=A0ABS5M9H7_9BACI|nr:retron St85 family RNA-directed DNA polymerase [Ornithinibacillus massiliensis]MBS3678966.1 retron St85 family RNA-directed DNA polymerase [Ornithinibacillus massiliensis]